jgi:hypothetical protein
MTLIGTVRRLLWRRPSYKRVGASEHRNGGPTNDSANPGSRRRLSDPPHRESEDDDDDDSDPYVEDDDLAHGPFVYAAFVMIGLAMLLRSSSSRHF